MQKTKLGISIGIMGAAVYFIGLLDFVPLVIVAGYILLMEENEWLRKSAVKSVMIVVVAALVPSFLGLLTYVFDFINIIFGWLHITFQLGYPLSLNTLITTAVYFVRDGLLLICGFTALSVGSTKVGFIDKAVNKNM